MGMSGQVCSNVALFMYTMFSCILLGISNMWCCRSNLGIRNGKILYLGLLFCVPVLVSVKWHVYK